MAAWAVMMTLVGSVDARAQPPGGYESFTIAAER